MAVEKPIATFKLLIGGHSGNDADGVGQQYDSKINNIIETRDNLLTLNGGPGFQPKFEKLNDGRRQDRQHQPQPAPVQSSFVTNPPAGVPVTTHAVETLNTMSIHELKKFAEEENININGLKTKDEIVKAIAISPVK